MADAQLKLPIRLIPRRSSAYAMALIVPAFGGVILASYLADLLDDWDRTNMLGAIRADPVLAVGLWIGAAVVLWTECIAILRALPSSPIFHLEISANGLKTRRLFKERFVDWSQVEALGIVQRMQKSGKSKRMHWWILAETAEWAADHDIDRRIKMALLAYDTEDLAAAFGTSEAAADDLLKLLNQLKPSTQENRAATVITLPPSLQGVAVPVGAAASVRKSGVAVNKPRRPTRSVIER